MRKADKNGDDKMSLKEVKKFMRQINLEVDDNYAELLFVVRERFHSNLCRCFVMMILILLNEKKLDH